MTGIPKDVDKALARVRRQNQPLAPSDFEQSSNTTGQRSEVLTLTADTATALKTGQSNPIKVAVPAYESFTTDATAGNTETFSLSNDLVDQPGNQSIVVWENGVYQGEPATVDYTNDTFDYTDDATGNTLHVYYVAGDPATLTIEKAMPGAQTGASEELYTANLGLIHQAEQDEQPEYLSLNDSPLQRFVAGDMDLSVYVDAPYTVKFSEDTDGTSATNGLLNLPAQVAQDTVPGLAQAIKRDMGSR